MGIMSEEYEAPWPNAGASSGLGGGREGDRPDTRSVNPILLMEQSLRIFQVKEWSGKGG